MYSVSHQKLVHLSPDLADVYETSIKFDRTGSVSQIPSETVVQMLTPKFTTRLATKDLPSRNLDTRRSLPSQTRKSPKLTTYA